MSNDYAPSFRIAKLYRRTSKAGGTYFSGRLGFAKVALVKSKETADDGAEVWSLKVSEAPQQEKTAAAPTPTSNTNTSARLYADRQKLDDEVPFAPEWR